MTARVQRRGGVLLTSYGMIVTSAELMAKKDGESFGADFLWVCYIIRFNLAGCVLPRGRPSWVDSYFISSTQTFHFMSLEKHRWFSIWSSVG